MDRSEDYPSYCDLVVRNFPANRNTLISSDFQLVYESEWCLHYWLTDNCHFKVNLKSDFTDQFFPKSNALDGNRNGRGVYFEIRGSLSKKALLQILRFLQLYTNQPGCADSTETQTNHRAIDKLEDITRMHLLCHFCSGKKYESVENLRRNLHAFLNCRFAEVVKFISEGSGINQSDVIVHHSRLWLRYRGKYRQTVYPDVQIRTTNRK